MIIYVQWFLLLTRFNFDLNMDSNDIHYKVWDVITYPFLNFNIEVWEWINNFIPQFTVHVITHRCWD